jgi:hypothetical protein
MPDERTCGACTLCCVVLRVDEIGKPGGTPCPKLRPAAAEGSCSIHAMRPEICRAYRCLWLQGGLDEEDRPDRLGAVLDVAPVGETYRLEIREALRGNFRASPRLRAIAERHRPIMPVRVTDVENVLDPDAPFRVLLPDGMEHLVVGDRVTIFRDGRELGTRRLPLLERAVRQLVLAWSRLRLRRSQRNRFDPEA